MIKIETRRLSLLHGRPIAVCEDFSLDFNNSCAINMRSDIQTYYYLCKLQKSENSGR